MTATGVDTPPGDGRPRLSVVVDGLAVGVRRRLGPSAWMVLEDLALNAERSVDGRLVARTSSRAVAGRLGRQASTVGDALRRLRAEGIARLVREDGDAGRFGIGVYELALPEGVSVLAPCHGLPCTEKPCMANPGTGDRDESGDRPSPAGRASRVRRGAAPTAGLTLFDGDGQ